MKLNKLIELMEFFYPIDLAESWDNIGLQVGDELKEIKRVMTVLEITNDVIDEAIERKTDVIISHHPLIFKPLKNLNYKQPQARLISKIIKNNIAIYSIHTNVDIASNGMNDWLAQVLELKNISILRKTKIKSYKKVTIKIEEYQLEELIDILKRSNAGYRRDTIEEYSLMPRIKKVKKLNGREFEKNVRVVETYVFEENIKQLKHELDVNQNYKYDIVNVEGLEQTFGLGRIGTIKPVSLEQFADNIKKLYSLDHVKIVGDREQVIKKVAVVGGSGSDLIIDAKLKNCDVIVTGDVGFHAAQDALASNISVIDPGHNIEIIFNDIMADFINLFDEITAYASEIDTNPFEVI